ncbi:hypothetical protein Bpro_0669 [Polaromonas sp. JS666]|nr:hypothetical protein Bpro_0669 [Polaromonas sp. JS666]
MVDDNLLTAGRRNATERVAMLLMHLYRRLDRIGLAQGGCACSTPGRWSALQITTTRRPVKYRCCRRGLAARAKVDADVKSDAKAARRATPEEAA